MGALVGLAVGCGSAGSTSPDERNTNGPSDAASSVPVHPNDAAGSGPNPTVSSGADAQSAAASGGPGPAAGADSGTTPPADAGHGSPSDSGSGADTGSAADASDVAADCTGGTTYEASNAGASAQVNGFGFVRLVADNQNQIVGFDTTLTAPTQPPPMGTLFLWPGLQPNTGGANFATLDNGVLQPVLTWGPTCAPNSPSSNFFASWWISAQYVNTFITAASSNFAAYSGCHGGPGMDVEVGDDLNITMVLSGANWIQTVTDGRSGASVSYTLDMMGQAQNIAEFVIENDGQPPVSDVIFTSTTLTFASSEASACQPQVRGTDDYFSAPQASSDGLHCCISKVILRAEGVAATSPDTP